MSPGLRATNAAAKEANSPATQAPSALPILLPPPMPQPAQASWPKSTTSLTIAIPAASSSSSYPASPGMQRAYSSPTSIDPGLLRIFPLPPHASTPRSFACSLLKKVSNCLCELAQAPSSASAAALAPIMEEPGQQFMTTLSANIESLCPPPQNAQEKIELTDTSIKFLFTEHLLIALNIFYVQSPLPTVTEDRAHFLQELHNEFMTQKLPQIRNYFHEKFNGEYDFARFTNIEDAIIKKTTNYFFMNKFFSHILFKEMQSELMRVSGKSEIELDLENNLVFFSFNRIGTGNPNFLIASAESDIDFNVLYNPQLLPLVFNGNPNAKERMGDIFKSTIKKYLSLLNALDLKIEFDPRFTFLSIDEAKKLRHSKTGGLFYFALQNEYQIMRGNEDLIKEVLGTETNFDITTPNGKIKLISLIKKLLDLYYTEFALKESFKKIAMGSKEIQEKLKKLQEKLEHIESQSLMHDLHDFLYLRHLIGFSKFSKTKFSKNRFLINTKTNFCRIGDIFNHGFIRKLREAVLEDTEKQENEESEKSKEFIQLLSQLTTTRCDTNIAHTFTNAGVMLQNLSILYLLNHPKVEQIRPLLDSLYSYTSSAQISSNPQKSIPVIAKIIEDANDSGLFNKSDLVNYLELKLLGLENEYEKIKNSHSSEAASFASSKHYRKFSILPTSLTMPTESQIEHQPPIKFKKVIVFLQTRIAQSIREKNEPQLKADLERLSYLVLSKLTDIAHNITQKFIELLQQHENYLNQKEATLLIENKELEQIGRDLKIPPELWHNWKIDDSVADYYSKKTDHLIPYVFSLDLPPDRFTDIQTVSFKQCKDFDFEIKYLKGKSLTIFAIPKKELVVSSGSSSAASSSSSSSGPAPSFLPTLPPLPDLSHPQLAFSGSSVPSKS
jgi:hypothetical protein